VPIGAPGDQEAELPSCLEDPVVVAGFELWVVGFYPLQTVGIEELNIGEEDLHFGMRPDGNPLAGIYEVDDLVGKDPLFGDKSRGTLAEVSLVGFVGGAHIALFYHSLGYMGASQRFCLAVSLYLLQVDAYPQRLEDSYHLFQSVPAGLLEPGHPSL